MMTWVRRTVAATLALGALWAGVSAAAVSPPAPTPASVEEYVIGLEDILEISVWLHPELERTVTVSNAGTIVYPPMGEVQAVGMTPKQLGDKLGERISSFLRQAAAVTVTVKEFNSRSVFVSGAVAKPGRYGFEHIPGLIDVLSQAGGALPGADLSQVQIFRKGAAGRRTLYADVASALRDGVGVGLPELEPGDAIVLQGAVGYDNAAGAGVGILGEVAKPGLYPVGASQDLWALIAAAGGPTVKGDLGSVRVIMRQGGGQVVATINLRDVLKRGARSPVAVRPGDVVFVGSSSSTARGKSWDGFQQVLVISRDLLNLVLLRDVLRRNK